MREQIRGILFSTVIVAVVFFVFPRRSVIVSVTIAVPGCFPSTSPVLLTLATVGLLLVRVMGFVVALMALKKFGVIVDCSQVIGFAPVVVVNVRVVPVVFSFTVKSVVGLYLRTPALMVVELNWTGSILKAEPAPVPRYST